MDYNDIRLAREQANRTIEQSNKAVREAAQLIAGHLRSSNTNGWILYELKQELKDFNMKTYSWKAK